MRESNSIFQAPYIYDREQQAKTTKDLRILNQAKIDEHDLVREAYASNENISELELERAFVLDPEKVDYALLLGASANPKATAKQLLTVADCDLVIARINAAGNPNADENVLMLLTNENQPRAVRIKAASNKNLTLKCFNQLNNNNCVRKLKEELVKTKFFGKDLLFAGIRDSISRSRLSNFLTNPNLDADFIRTLKSLYLTNDPKAIDYAEFVLQLPNTPADVLESMITFKYSMSLSSISLDDFPKLILNHQNITSEILELARLSKDEKVVSAYYASTKLSTSLLVLYFESTDSNIMKSVCANPNATPEQLKKGFNFKPRSSNLIENICKNPATDKELVDLILATGTSSWTLKSLMSNQYLPEQYLIENCKQFAALGSYDNKGITESVLEKILISSDKIPKVFYTCPVMTDKVLFRALELGHTDALSYLKHPSEELMLKMLEVLDSDNVIEFLENCPYITDRVITKIDSLNPFFSKERKCSGYSFAKLKAKLIDSNSKTKLNNKITTTQIKSFFGKNFSAGVRKSVLDASTEIFKQPLVTSESLNDILNLTVNFSGDQLKEAIISSEFTSDDILRKLITDNSSSIDARLKFFSRVDVKAKQGLLDDALKTNNLELIEGAITHYTFTKERQYKIITTYHELVQAAMIKQLKNKTDLLVLAIATKSEFVSVANAANCVNI